MAGIIWPRRAFIQYRSQIAYLRTHSGSGRIADKWSVKITRAVARLALLPESGSPVEEFPGHGFREIFVGPYRVIYKYDGTNCTIAAFAHGKQDLRIVMPEYAGNEP